MNPFRVRGKGIIEGMREILKDLKNQRQRREE